jgi:glycosyltransferase involved in cell wall biosynthesis
MRACLVLPTLNEAPNLPPLLAAIRRAVPDLPILVVDDRSPDGTGAIAEELAARDEYLTVLHRDGPRGFGAALTAGFRRALADGAEAVLTMDGDFSHDPAEIKRLLGALESADMVIGSRYTAGGTIEAWSLYRRLLSAAANAFVRVLYDLPARDCTSGFRCYRRQALQAVPWERLHSTGYSFLVEVLYWASRSPQARVREIPIRFTERRAGRSKMGFREIVAGVFNLIRLRLGLLASGGPPRG